MSIISGILNAKASKKASSEQAASEAAAQAEMRREFDITHEDQAPWLESGRRALSQLNTLLGLGAPISSSNPIDPNTGQPMGATDAPGTPDYSAFFNSPDYAFARDMGQQGIERSAAARGGLLSGNTLAAASKFNSGLATQNYGNYVNRLLGLSGLGQTSAAELGNAGANYSNGLGQSLTRQGDARASGIIGSQAAYSNAAADAFKWANTLWGKGGIWGKG